MPSELALLHLIKLTTLELILLNMSKHISKPTLINRNMVRYVVNTKGSIKINNMWNQVISDIKTWSIKELRFTELTNVVGIEEHGKVLQNT